MNTGTVIEISLILFNFSFVNVNFEILQFSPTIIYHQNFLDSTFLQTYGCKDDCLFYFFVPHRCSRLPPSTNIYPEML